MENDLQTIYTNMYKPQTNSGLVKESTEFGAEDDDTEECENKKVAKAPKGKKKRKISKEDAGRFYLGDSYSFDNVFGKVLREMDEMGGDLEGGDNVFDGDAAGGGYEDDDMLNGGGDAEGILRSIFDQLKSYFGEDEDFGDDEDLDGDFGGEEDLDEVPTESYAFTGGEGNPKGAQGNYDGKARKQAKTTHVKDNGDSRFDDQDTGYDPEDVEGSEGAEHGAQGNYDGKARTQAKSTNTKPNGDSDFGKMKTGYKTSSGKKEKNYF